MLYISDIRFVCLGDSEVDVVRDSAGGRRWAWLAGWFQGTALWALCVCESVRGEEDLREVGELRHSRTRDRESIWRG